MPFLVPALGGLLFGYDIGSSSAVVRILGEKVTDLGKLDAIALGQVASGSLFGAMAISAVLIVAGDKKIGRRQELRAASVLFTLGTCIQSFTGKFGLASVLVGRAIYGLGIGTAMHAAPLYIGESAPDNLRGKLVSLKEAAIVAGIVAGYAAGAVFGSSGGWESVYASALPVEALMFAGTFAIPESSRWLALRGRPEEAVQALQQAQGLPKEKCETLVKKMGVGNTDDLLQAMGRLTEAGVTRKALTIGVGLVVFQQLSGQPSVLYYANNIFERAGLGFEAAVGVGVFKGVMTLVSVSLVENPKWGRRPLLLLGTAGMTGSLLALSLLFAGGADAINQSAVILAIVSYVGFYQIGFGPITWLILSEIFPLNVRAAALSVGTLTNFASNLLVTLLFEAERQSVGESLLFLQFAFIAGLALAFENSLVPETRGLSLEEIEEKLGQD